MRRVRARQGLGQAVLLESMHVLMSQHQSIPYAMLRGAGSLWDHYHKEKAPQPHAKHMQLALQMAIDMAKG